MISDDGRIPVLYLAPWLDIGGSDKGTLDWLRFIDRGRFRASLITTQPRPNRRLAEGSRYAEEIWDLPELMVGNEFARFILTFLHTRNVRIVHLMNSRLGFELLPDIAHLPDRPRVVVQLHVEEPDCSGYVRYVTTRYGNLVDAFSVSSQALSDALDAYDVPRAKRRVILTGVDAEREFNPARIVPTPGLDGAGLQILYPTRLTAQKDPLLMVEVAARLRDHGTEFRMHVLGDGELEEPVRRRIDSAGLKRHVLLHGTTIDMGRWYAACDVLLLTSEFEGIPYAIYEAMAMATPVVAPALAGIAELVTPQTGVLVDPREDAGQYAAALARLAADDRLRARIGADARDRARSELSLERMASEHEQLYEELLRYDHLLAREDGPRSVERRAAPRGTRSQDPCLRDRRPDARPLVSVIVPCYNHGRFLGACLESVWAQTYGAIETIVVDNASTDPETLEALAQVEAGGAVKLVRLARNGGPSGARNAAIADARGRYMLPLDADNMLVRDAVAALVEQLSAAGEQIGFIYPNYDFFGNRREYFEPPSYNLHALMRSNYCDSSSLIDREVFDRGFRYPEDVVLGMEDWDLVLTLAEHGIFGEPARSRTLRYRKHGFNRNDLIEAGSVPFSELLVERHPGLYGRGAWLKGRWSPAVSLIALDPIANPAIRSLVDAAVRQTCDDFEVIVVAPDELWPTELGGRLRRIPSELPDSRARTLARAVGIARGRHLLGAYGSPAALLSDPTIVEKALRLLVCGPQLDALALAESDPQLAPFRLLADSHARVATLGALCWPAGGPALPPASLELPGATPLEALVRWLSAHATVQWRHVPRRDRKAVALPGGGPAAQYGTRRHLRVRDQPLRDGTAPELPQLPPGVGARISRMQVWTPPLARALCRYLHPPSGQCAFGTDLNPPAGHILERHLGALRTLPLAGTRSLVWLDDEFTLGDAAPLDAPGLLGFVEQAPLPLFDPLFVARHRRTGQRVLVAGDDDDVAREVEDRVHLGFIEPFPIHPRRAPHADVFYGLVGLVRTVDLVARRHRYGAGRIPEGRLVGELGALLTEPLGECEPVWIDHDGRVSTSRAVPANGRPPLRKAVRWTGAPLTWRGFGSPLPKAKAAARRAYDSMRLLSTSAPTPAGPLREPAGYLALSPQGRTIPLYSATHPITGDQLLCTEEEEAWQCGYENVVPIGHLIARAPVTGALGVDRGVGVPWASRFGRTVWTR